MRCTGQSARWCPVHGDCKCAEPVLGPLDDPACPLHAPTSEHAHYPSERLEAAAIINGLLAGEPPFDGWHHIDNADNDLLREIIKQLIDAGWHDGPKVSDEYRAETEHLRAWKAEAMEVLAEWEKVWVAAGRPGPLGGSKAENVRRQIERNRAVLDAADAMLLFNDTSHVCPDYDTCCRGAEDHLLAAVRARREAQR